MDSIFDILTGSRKQDFFFSLLFLVTCADVYVQSIKERVQSSSDKQQTLLRKHRDEGQSQVHALYV